MFHLELRQRPHVARAFNLEEADLLARFLGPHLAGRTLDYQDREWPAKKTTVRIVEGPELSVVQMGMGRGWANANRAGVDVTERLIALARERTQRPEGLDRLKERLLGRLAGGSILLLETVTMADNLRAGHRVSVRLALAEQAVWELLHEHSAQLVSGDGGPVLSEAEWGPALLSADAWMSAGEPVRLAPITR